MNKRKRKPINIPKHKGQNLSFAQKHEICKRYAKKPRPSQIDLANEYCVSQSSISEILSNREKWISIDESEVHKKKNRQAKFPELEEALVMWIIQSLQENLTITGDVIKLKACDFRNKLRIQNFKASNGWLENFKNRYHIHSYLKSGEGQSAPIETLDEERMKLREIIKEYDLKDVFNCDETGERLYIRQSVQLTLMLFHFR